jgi:hypothetical protein
MRAGRLVLGLLIVAIGGGWLLQALGAVDQFPWEWVLPSVLLVIGVALVADPRGKSHGGLIGLGIILTIVLVAGGAGSPAFTTGSGVGDRTVTVSSVTDLEDVSMFAGSLVVDLRDLDLPSGSTTLDVSVFAGEIKVYVPRTATVEVKANTLFGQIDAFGERRDGVGVNLDTTSQGSGGTLVLKASAFAGQIGVSR